MIASGDHPLPQGREPPSRLPRAPLLVRRFRRVLRKDRAEQRGDHRPLAGRHPAEQIPHPMNTTPLERGVQHLARGRPQTLVVVGDHQLHPAQAAVGQRAQEIGPERLCLRGAGCHAARERRSRASRRPSVFTPVAMITAVLMIRPCSRT
jgi:hypothetical protein